MTDSACFQTCVTPAADCVASSDISSLQPRPRTSSPATAPLSVSVNFPRRASEPLLEFALAGWDAAAAISHVLLPGSAFIDHDSFIDLPVKEEGSCCSGTVLKTFNEMTPEEFAHIACQIEADVFSSPDTATITDIPSAYATPADHTVAFDNAYTAGSGAIRSARDSVVRDHPYWSVPPPPQPHSAGLSASFHDFLSIMSPSANALAADGDATTTPILPPSHHSSPDHEPVRVGQYLCEWEGCTTAPFSSIDILTAHILHRHVPRRRSQYPCLWTGCPRGGCARPFPKRHKLVAHLRSHTLERPFVCDDCGRSFAREDSREAHAKVHGTERVGPWGCSCQGGRVWQTWRGVRRHQATGSCAGVVQLSTGKPVEPSTRQRSRSAAVTVKDELDDMVFGFEPGHDDDEDDNDEDEDYDGMDCDE